jgi:hypothetical protein
MGFEKNKRIVKTMNNQRVTAVVGGKKCYFRSIFEFRWARYLQFLKESGIIKDWRYESDVFNFIGETTSPVMYRPDFFILENNCKGYYQECKGYHDGQTNTKLKRMQKHFPEIQIELVLMRFESKGKGAARRQIASKYARRIIDASIIFSQTKGVVNYDVPLEC